MKSSKTRKKKQCVYKPVGEKRPRGWGRVVMNVDSGDLFARISCKDPVSGKKRKCFFVPVSSEKEGCEVLDEIRKSKNPFRTAQKEKTDAEKRRLEQVEKRRMEDNESELTARAFGEGMILWDALEKNGWDEESPAVKKRMASSRKALRYLVTFDYCSMFYASRRYVRRAVMECGVPREEFERGFLTVNRIKSLKKAHPKFKQCSSNNFVKTGNCKLTLDHIVPLNVGVKRLVAELIKRKDAPDVRTAVREAVTSSGIVRIAMQTCGITIEEDVVLRKDYKDKRPGGWERCYGKCDISWGKLTREWISECLKNERK